MRLRDCASTAWYDLRQKPGFFLRLLLGILFVQMILLVSTLSMQGVTNYYQSTVVGMRYSNQLLYSMQPTQTALCSEVDAERIAKLEAIPQLSDWSCMCSVDLPALVGDAQKAYVNLNRVSLQTETGSFSAAQETASAARTGKPQSLQIAAFWDRYGLLSQNDLDSFAYAFPGQSVVLAGRLPEQSGELALSSAMLRTFGISDDAALLGQTVSIAVDGVPCLEKLRLVGVLNPSFFQYGNFHNGAEIWLCAEEAQLCALPLESCFLTAAVRAWSDGSHVAQQLEAAQLTHDVFYHADEAQTYCYIEQVKSLAEFVVKTVLGFVLLAMALSIWGMLQSHIHASAAYYGMLHAIGMPLTASFCIFLLAQGILCLGVALLSIPVGAFLVAALNRVLYLLIGDGIAITAPQFWKNLIQTSASVSGAVLLLSVGLLAGQFCRPITVQLRRVKG